MKSYRDRYRCRFSRALSRSRERAKRAGYAPCNATPDTLKQAFFGKCYICGIDEPEERQLCVDHDHTTGEFRGFLCDCCNRGLGYFGDDAEKLKAALLYIKGAELVHAS